MKNPVKAVIAIRVKKLILLRPKQKPSKLKPKREILSLRIKLLTKAFIRIKEGIRNGGITGWAVKVTVGGMIGYMWLYEED